HAGSGSISSIHQTHRRLGPAVLQQDFSSTRQLPGALATGRIVKSQDEIPLGGGEQIPFDHLPRRQQVAQTNAGEIMAQGGPRHAPTTPAPLACHLALARGPAMLVLFPCPSDCRAAPPSDSGAPAKPGTRYSRQ